MSFLVPISTKTTILSLISISWYQMGKPLKSELPLWYAEVDIETANDAF